MKNYQLLQMMQQQQQMQAQMQGQPQMQPQMQMPQQQMQPQPQMPPMEQQRQAPYNPFDVGIKRAMEAARETFGMNQRQREGALNKALLQGGNAISHEPKQRGFWNNLASIGRAAAPAMMSYSQSEEQAEQQNHEAAREMEAYRAREEALAAAEAERQWHHRQVEEGAEERAAHHEWQRNLAERQFAESGRHNGLLEQMRQANMVQNVPQEETSPLVNDGFIPIGSKTEKTAYLKDKKALGSVLKEVNDLDAAYKKLREDTKNNVFDPMLPAGRAVNSAEGLWGKFGNNKKLRNEKAAREAFKSTLNKFVVTSERALKGGGILGPRIIETFKAQGIYPDYNDDPETFEKKLALFKEEIGNGYKAANYSLKHGVHIDPMELQKIEQPSEGVAVPLEQSVPVNDSGEEEKIWVINPEGEEGEIPASKKAEHLARGYKLMD